MVYINKMRHIVLSISTITLLFLIDLSQFFFIGALITPLLLSSYCIFTIYNPKYPIIAFICFLLGLEYFCFYNSFSLAITILAPLSILGIFLRRNLYLSYSHSVLLGLTGILIQTYAVEGFFLHNWITKYYIIMRISGTLLMIICFSLTINIWGVQDNRA